MPAAIALTLTRQFPSSQGVPDVEAIARSLHTESLHSPGTRLIILENTHNRAGGAIIPLEIHREIHGLAGAHDVPIHLDGARLFNAVVATGVPAREYAACADSVTFCLSKGLGCPVGSVLCGSRDFVARARRVRKMLGGGMRQAGLLAAAGLYALEHHIERLAEDHRHAQRLAQGIAAVSGIRLDTDRPPTNMVYFTTLRVPARDFVNALRERHSVLCASTAPDRIRLVTHLDVREQQIDRAVEALQEVAALL